jgi:hypothetical protein
MKTEIFIGLLEPVLAFGITILIILILDFVIKLTFS